MSARMVVCAACELHVKNSDRICPFCGAKMSTTKAEAARASPRLSRAALYTLGAAGVLSTSIAATSCGAAYGGPPTGGAGGAGGEPSTGSGQDAGPG